MEYRLRSKAEYLNSDTFIHDCRLLIQKILYIGDQKFYLILKPFTEFCVRKGSLFYKFV
jgi:hypothetical protein